MAAFEATVSPDATRTTAPPATSRARDAERTNGATAPDADVTVASRTVATGSRAGATEPCMHGWSQHARQPFAK